MQTENSSWQQAGAGSANIVSIRDQVLEALKSSKEYRHAFIAESIATRLATQISAIRTENTWSPKEFSDRLGSKVSWVYRLEDPNMPLPTLPSLLNVAEALDIGLDVRFRRFSELLDDATNLNPESFLVPSFEAEIKAGAFKTKHHGTRKKRSNRPRLLVLSKGTKTRRKGVVVAEKNYGTRRPSDLRSQVE